MKFLRPPLFLFSLLAFSFLSVSSVLAKVVSVESGDYQLFKDQVIDDDLFVAAANVTIDGEVKGNLYAAGAAVNINGKIDGSVYAGSATVSLDKAQITQDLVAGAGSIILKESNLGGSLLVGSGSITIDDKSEISGGVTAGSGSVVVNGKVGRGLMIGAGTLAINSEIGKEIQTAVDSLTIGDKAKINSDITYVSAKDAKVETGAQLSGAIKKVIPKDSKAKEAAAKIGAIKLGAIGRTLNIGWTLWSLFGSILIGLILVFLFGKPLSEISENVIREPLKLFGVGLLAVALFPMVFILLMITFIGIPLAFILLLLLIIVGFMAKFLLALVFGGALLDLVEKKEINLYWKMILGLVVYYVLVSLPILGWFVRIIVCLTGIGAVIHNFFLKKTSVSPS